MALELGRGELVYWSSTSFEDWNDLDIEGEELVIVSVIAEENKHGLLTRERL